MLVSHHVTNVLAYMLVWLVSLHFLKITLMSNTRLKVKFGASEVMAKKNEHGRRVGDQRHVIGRLRLIYLSVT